ncbi:isoleucine--tRNA ligase [Candidatus Dependentiae bacterium]|nr:isoleucine--tRNA ligase [Candidatus Dependentiae bacterium]
MVDEKSPVSFKDTLNLPTTTFPIRPNHLVDDPVLLERWQKENLYSKAFKLNEGNEKFILHDGPPYANGHIHLGHAYNKILKDIVSKSQRMAGKHVPVTPGWDCHGLPIEIKVTKENPELHGLPLLQACRAYAQQWIDVQRKEFKQLGVVMDWDHPYLTMNPSYEAETIRAFGTFVADGYMEKKKKTVPWCFHDQTVLATAEIEHKERKDPSIYVRFPLAAESIKKLFPALAGNKINLLIWTTTPWTLPLNRAVLAKPSATYAVIKVGEEYLVVGKSLIEKVMALNNATPQIVAELKGEQLASAQVQHPFIENLRVPIIADDSVSLDDGTAFVHCAPGCGPEDYEVGVKNNLEIFSPISADGKYLPGIEPKELEGMLVTDGQIWVIKKLAELNRMWFKGSIKHNYPHCWRCHNGLIFRATNQWFCNLSHGNLKQKALQAIEKIAFLPERSGNFLRATIEGRLEWCLSRQRSWGVPIPAVLCTQCEHVIITPELVEFVAKGVEKEGIEYWQDLKMHELPFKLKCPKCSSTTFAKEKDILDVWFDSGISHYAVLKENPALRFPADMYLEGIDQHRGWFQSSLLTSLVLEKEAAMKSILTHGFTVDEKGHKMSKSIGNVVSPDEMIKQIGTDGLRLWASSIDYSGDAIVSKELIGNVSEVYRKIRNTCRFLLSNLYDFDAEKDLIPLDEMMVIDHYALEQLYYLNASIRAAYEIADLTAVFHKLSDYCSKELSSFYLDVIKDRLYTEKANGAKRRSAQTACWYILDTLTRLMAPVLSFTAENISDVYQKEKKDSIHLQPFTNLADIWQSMIARTSQSSVQGIDWYPFEGRAQETADAIRKLSFVTESQEQWELLKEIRSAILKAIEEKRAENLIKHSLEARVSVHFNFDEHRNEILNDFFAMLERHHEKIDEFFQEFLIVSQFQVELSPKKLNESDLKGFSLIVEHARGNKCPRCWKWEENNNEYHLCNRCKEVLT